MSDNFTLLLQKSMPEEYSILNKLNLDFKNARTQETTKEIGSKLNAQENDIHRHQVRYLKHCFSIPQSVNHPIAFTESLTKLPYLHFRRAVDALWSNLHIFLNNDIWFQILINNIKDNASFSNYMSWKHSGEPVLINPSGIIFEELKIEYSNKTFKNLSEESERRINKAISEITNSPLSQKEKQNQLGISRTTYNTYILNGCSGQISKRLLFSLSHATGYSPDYLLDLSDHETMYLTYTIPKAPLSDWFHTNITSEAREKIIYRLNCIYSLNREGYEEMKKEFHLTENYLKEVRNSKNIDISVALLNGIGKTDNIHPLVLTGQIKTFLPYETPKENETLPKKKPLASLPAATSFSKYTTSFLEASKAFDILETHNNVSNQRLRECLFIIFVYLDKATRNMILDNFSDMVNFFLNDQQSKSHD